MTRDPRAARTSPSREPLSPRVRLLAGCVAISFSSVFANLTTVAPTVSAFYRVAIGGAVLTAILVVKRCPLTRRPTPVTLLLAAAVFFALDLALWHRSIEYIGPGLSTLLASFQVFFMTAAGLVFFGQRPSLQQLVAVPMAILGLALLVGLDWSVLSPEYRAGIVLGLLTAMTYAGYMLTLRQSQAGGSGRLPVTELAIVSLGSAGLLAVSVIVEGESFALGAPIDVVWLGCLGVVCHVGGWLLIASSLPRLSPAIAGLTLTMQPVLTLGWDILIFDRGLTLLEATGGLLTLTAIWLGSRGNARRRGAD